jgi:hypothetical protein
MWKSIPGYENLYEASDDGLIRTVQNKTTKENIRYGFDNGLYANNCNGIEILSQSGNVLEFDSYSKCDRFLHQYNGYTSRNVCLKRDVIKSKDGQIFYVKR